MDYLEFNFKVCNNLRLLRSATSMSQHAIASALGISRSSYGAIEAGRQTLSLYHAIMLSEIFRVSCDKLWSDDLQKTIFNEHESQLFKSSKSG